MDIIKRPLEALNPDTRNARTHDERNMQAIIDSLTTHGQVEPLVVQQGTGRVVGGNGRLEAMRQMGWTQAEVVEVPLTDAQATALGISLNRTAELGDWDLDRLEKSLGGLREEFDLTKLGFDANELERLLARQVEEEGDLVEVDLPEDQHQGPPPGSGGPTDAGPADSTGGAPSGGPGPEHLPRAEPDPAQRPGPVRQLRPVALHFEPDDAVAFFKVAEDAEELLGTHGLSETCLAALRRICGQAIFPDKVAPEAG